VLAGALPFSVRTLTAKKPVVHQHSQSSKPLYSPAHSLWKEILQRRRRKGVCRNPMMIEDDEALKHQENGPPGGKQTLANS
jgi:hypothetical protein